MILHGGSLSTRGMFGPCFLFQRVAGLLIENNPRLTVIFSQVLNSFGKCLSKIGYFLHLRCFLHTLQDSHCIDYKTLYIIITRIVIFNPRLVHQGLVLGNNFLFGKFIGRNRFRNAWYRLNCMNYTRFTSWCE